MITYYNLPNKAKETERQNLLTKSKSEKLRLQSLLCEYLKDPMLLKVKEEIQQDTIYGVYVTKVHCMLSITRRYIILFVPEFSEKRTEIGELRRMGELNWTSLQFRTFPLIRAYEAAPTLVHTFGFEQELVDVKVHKVKTTEEASVYEADSYPFTVVLMHTDKKTSLDYKDKGNLLASLVTWETVVNSKV